MMVGKGMCTCVVALCLWDLLAISPSRVDGESAVTSTPAPSTEPSYVASCTLLAPGGNSTFTLDELRNVSTRVLGVTLDHNVATATPIVGVVSDAIGRRLPFSPVTIKLRKDVGEHAETSEVPSTSGNLTRANAQGVVNFTQLFMFTNCSHEGWSFLIQLCPVLEEEQQQQNGGGGGGTAGGNNTELVRCSRYIRIFIGSHPSKLILAPSPAFPEAILGMRMTPISLSFLSSCNQPLGGSGVNNALSRRLGHNSTVAHLDTRGVVGRIRSQITEKVANLTFPGAADGKPTRELLHLVAYFDDLKMTYVPKGASSDLVDLHFDLAGEGIKETSSSSVLVNAAAPVDENNNNEGEGGGTGTQEGPEAQVTSHIEVSVTLQQLTMNPSINIEEDGGDETAIHRRVKATMDAHYVNNIWSFPEKLRLPFNETEQGTVLTTQEQISSYELLRSESIAFVFTFAFHVFNDNEAWIRNEDARAKNRRLLTQEQKGFLDLVDSPNCFLVMNTSLALTPTYGSNEAPRGMVYGLENHLVKQLEPFETRAYDTVHGFVFTAYHIPILLGPLETLHSTLVDTVNVEFVPNLFKTQAYVPVLPPYFISDFFAEGNEEGKKEITVEQVPSEALPPRETLYMDALRPQMVVRAELKVRGLPTTLLQRYRQFSTLTALVNPDVAYVSTLIAVVDCSADVGQGLDLSVHPLHFAIGSHSIIKYLLGAVVSNCGLLIVVTGVTFLFSKWFSSRELTAKIFPFFAMYLAILLYPGTTYVSFALLPYVKGGLYVAWLVPGVIFFVGYPCVVVNLGYRFAPEYLPSTFNRVTILAKIFAPLGYYRVTHADHTRWRATYAPFRGPHKWFFAADFACWGVTSFNAYIRDCRQRYIAPLIVNCIYFALLVSRAPHMTTYRNLLAFISSIVKVIALVHLAWDEQETKFNRILTTWVVILPVLSISFVCFEYITRRFMLFDFLKIDTNDEQEEMEGYLLLDEVPVATNDDDNDSSDDEEDDDAGGVEQQKASPGPNSASPLPSPKSPQQRSPRDDCIHQPPRSPKKKRHIPMGTDGLPIGDDEVPIEDLLPPPNPEVKVIPSMHREILEDLKAHRVEMGLRKEEEYLTKQIAQQRQRDAREAVIARNLQDKRRAEEGHRELDENWRPKASSVTYQRKTDAKGKSFSYLGPRDDRLAHSEFVEDEEDGEDDEKNRRSSPKGKSSRESRRKKKQQATEYDNWHDDCYKPWQSQADILHEIQGILRDTTLEKEARKRKVKEQTEIEKEADVYLRRGREEEKRRKRAESIKQEQREELHRTLKMSSAKKSIKRPPREHGFLRLLPDGRWVEEGLVPRDVHEMMSEQKRKEEEQHRAMEGMVYVDEGGNEVVMSAQEYEGLVMERRSAEMYRKLYGGRAQASAEAAQKGPPPEANTTYVPPPMKAPVKTALTPQFKRLLDLRLKEEAELQKAKPPPEEKKSPPKSASSSPRSQFGPSSPNRGGGSFTGL